MQTCAWCGSNVFRGDETAYKWQRDWFCGMDCAHELGDRTHCLVLECNCTKCSKVHRALRGFLTIRNRQRTRLARQGHLTESDFNMRIGRYENLPYQPDGDMLEDLMDRQRDSDDLDPDRAARDAELRSAIGADAAASAASQAAMVEAVAEIALHNENKRRRLDNSSDLEDMRLQLERKSMQCEDLMSKELRSS